MEVRLHGLEVDTESREPDSQQRVIGTPNQGPRGCLYLWVPTSSGTLFCLIINVYWIRV